MNPEEPKELTPKEKTDQIERRDNWIVEFWRVRGYEIVKTALGISFTLHRKPEWEYKGLGLDLTYLEQFEQKGIDRYKQKVKELLDKYNMKIHHPILYKELGLE